MLRLPNTINDSCSPKPNQAGVENMAGVRGSGTKGWTEQGRRGAGLWTWEAAGSHTYTPSGLRLDTRGFWRLRGCPRNCFAVGRGGDSNGVTPWSELKEEISLDDTNQVYHNIILIFEGLFPYFHPCIHPVEIAPVAPEALCVSWFEQAGHPPVE